MRQECKGAGATVAVHWENATLITYGSVVRSRGPLGVNIMNTSRRALVIGASLVGAVLAPSGSAFAACAEPSTGSVPLAPISSTDKPVVFRGSGGGHSLGMSQYGARGAALLGCSADEILTTYYSGARPTTSAMPRSIGVWMLQSGTSATVTAEPDSTQAAVVKWRQEGRLVAVQDEGTTWTVRQSGSVITLTDHTGVVRFSRSTPVKPLLAAHTGVVARLRTFAGSSLRIERRNKWDYTRFDYTTGGLDAQQWFRNNTDGPAMNKYLYGLAEVPTSWPAATQQAQAVAARTFAFRVARVLYASSRDQYYAGHDPSRDSPASAWRQAVDATSDRVMVDGAGRPIQAFYSASMAGSTEDNRYVWGGAEVPYLGAVDDSAWANAASDPYAQWSKSFTMDEIAAEFGFTSVSAVTVGAKGTADRLRGVRITGTDDGATVTRSFTGWDVSQRLGLRSPGFVITIR